MLPKTLTSRSYEEAAGLSSISGLILGAEMKLLASDLANTSPQVEQMSFLPKMRKLQRGHW
jgi:hypothetical protein